MTETTKQSMTIDGVTVELTTDRKLTKTEIVDVLKQCLDEAVAAAMPEERKRRIALREKQEAEEKKQRDAEAVLRQKKWQATSQYLDTLSSGDREAFIDSAFDNCEHEFIKRLARNYRENPDDDGLYAAAFQVLLTDHFEDQFGSVAA